MGKFVTTYFNFLSVQQQQAWAKVLSEATDAQQAELKDCITAEPELAHTVWEQFALHLYLETNKFSAAEKTNITQALHV